MLVGVVLGLGLGSGSSGWGQWGSRGGSPWVGVSGVLGAAAPKVGRGGLGRGSNPIPIPNHGVV